MRTPVLFACAALLLAAPAPASAQAAPSEAQVTARKRAEEGLSLFKDGRWEDAYAAFAEADRMFHAPTLVAYMGTCRRNQGRLVEARALYEKVLAEPVPPNAPEAFKKAMETARTEADKLRGRIPLLKVKLVGAGADGARVTLDGAPVTAAELAAGKLVDPGEHQIAAEAPGAAARAKIALKEGDAPAIEVRLEPAGGPIAPEKPKAAERRPGSMVPAGIAFGVGGAGIVLGVATGVIALSKISQAQEGCTPPDASGARHCPAGNEPAASSARALTAASTAGFVIGGVGIATGVVLAIVRPGGAKDKVALDVGPGFMSVRGRF